ncbi:MAG: glycine cleavage system aminomethyltransferase GcvT [Bacteroidia bacterium]
MSQELPLVSYHEALGAQWSFFGGYQMPIRYHSEISEHLSTRQNAGLFDLSHMGEFLVRGPKAAEFLQKMTPNDISKLTPGKAQYNLLLNPEGGIIDDLIVYQLEDALYLLVVNAANTQKDWEWLTEHLPVQGVTMQNISEETVLLAVSGPRSTEIVALLTDLPVHQMRYYMGLKGTVAGVKNVWVATTGYTGEWTYELFLRAEDAPRLWEAIWEVGKPHGLTPAGLAARNTLRLEMGYLLHGKDITEQTSPWQARLDWVVKLKKGDFIGRESLLQEKNQGIKQFLWGLVLPDRLIARDGTSLTHHGEPIGLVTSGSYSPTLQKGIALAYLPADYNHTQVEVPIRSSVQTATLVRPPFVTQTSLKK